jgi:two-component sensor histidine kinase/CheY-like chemotaxis protein
MVSNDRVNVLLVDDQPAKLLAYEVILQELGENLLTASSAREALETLLKTDVAIVLIDVCMPEFDGFELAAMIRDHPRFRQTAIIFVSAIHLTDVDRLRGYEMGAVDYVPVPVIPEVLRAKVKVFAELFRKTRQLEQLNAELERRVSERTAELEASNRRLLESEQRRSLALAAGKMGSWEWDIATGECHWDAGQYRIFGMEPGPGSLSFDRIEPMIHRDDFAKIKAIMEQGGKTNKTFQTEVRINRPDGQTRWCICAGAVTTDLRGQIKSVSGVSTDISELREAEQRRTLLVREVDHRARNVLAIVQSIIRMTKERTIESYVSMVTGRISALSIAHGLLAESRWEGASLRRLASEELAPYRNSDNERISIDGPDVVLRPEVAQTIALALHELATNAVKYGALSDGTGVVSVSWNEQDGQLKLRWVESGGPTVHVPTTKGYGTKVIDASITKQLGGKADFEWRATGLAFTMSVPLAKEGLGAETGSPAAATEDALDLPAESGKGFVLLVEDEALVGMMMTDLLSHLGFQVLGPYGRTADAIEAIGRHPIDAAVLDINLGEELVYDLAESLVKRGIPIAFVTGYGAECLDQRFADAPVLQKPVDTAALRQVLERSAKLTTVSPLAG